MKLSGNTIQRKRNSQQPIALILKLANMTYVHPYCIVFKTRSRQPVSHLTLRSKVSNVNISATIYPPFKRKPLLKSSQKTLSNGVSSAVKALHKLKLTAWPNFCNSYRKKVEHLLNFTLFSQRLYE